MAGAQAQILSAAQLSLWARIEGLTRETLATALGRDRTLARAWCMRRTVYLLPCDALAIYVRGSARRADREITWLSGKGVPRPQIETLIGSVLAALDRPRTRAELAERVGADLGLRPAMYRGGGWGNERVQAALQIGGIAIPGDYLLHLAGARGVICAGPPRGAEGTFVRADRWVRGWRDVSPERAEEELLRRYLRAFGPAGLEEFDWWTGLRLSDVRPIWSRIEGELARVEMEGTTGWSLRSDLSDLEGATLDRTAVHLLPYFDSFLLGHGKERHAVRSHHRPEVYRPAGWVAPVVLVRGRAAGTWAHTRRGGRLEVRVAPFAPLAVDAARRVRARGRALGRFLGCGQVETTIGEATTARGPTVERPRRGTA
jgi:Winged helix DNA-binding domain